MKYIALLGWFLFVVWYLRAERSNSGERGYTSWVPTIWMLWAASRPIARWLDPHGAISEDAGSGVDRLFLLGLLAVSCWIVSRRRTGAGAALRRDVPMLLLLAYVLASCVWSDVPMTSFKQWVRLLGAAVVPLVVLTESNPASVLERVLMRTTYVLIPLSIVLIKWFPEQGIDYRDWNGEKFWVGVCLHKNSLGRLCLVCGATTIWTLIKRRRRKEPQICRYQNYIEFGFLGLIAFMLKGPETNYPVTSIATLSLAAMSLFGLILLKRRLANRLFAGLSVFTILVALLLMLISVTGYIPSFGTAKLGRDATFTGRTDIWNGVREVAWQSPLLGQGYGAYWCKHHEFPNVGIVNEGHNGYLDTFVETGLIGDAIILMMLIVYARRAMRERFYNYDLACFRIVFLLIMVLHNFTETSFLTASGHLWALFIFMYIIVAPPGAAMVYPVEDGTESQSRGGPTGPKHGTVSQFAEQG